MNSAVINIETESIPSAYFLSSIKSATADRIRGNIYSFKNNKAAIHFLNNKFALDKTKADN